MTKLEYFQIINFQIHLRDLISRRMQILRKSLSTGVRTNAISNRRNGHT